MRKEVVMNVDAALWAGRQEWIGFAVLALARGVYASDLSVLKLGVPSLRTDLRPSSSSCSVYRAPGPTNVRDGNRTGASSRRIREAYPGRRSFQAHAPRDRVCCLLAGPRPD